MKKLIIASAFSMMAAGCYAGTLVPNSDVSVSADVSFTAPGKINAQLTPVTGLVSGSHLSGETLATLTVSGTNKQYAVTGDYSKPETVNTNSDVWKVNGKNGNTITVTFAGVNVGSKTTLIDSAKHKWWIYNNTDKVAVLLSGAQNVKADIYPVTLNVAEYQP